MCGVVIRTLIGMLALVPAGAYAATIQLPRTGQTTCFNQAGVEISCTSPEAAGQDANRAVGAVLPEAPRFTEPATPNGTLTDKLTDLVWLKEADCLQGPKTWQEAIDRARTLAPGVCNLSDTSTAGSWRVPNRKELLSLIRFQVPDGVEMLNSQGFVNGAHDWYWTSDTYVRNPAQKWVVHPVGDAHGNEFPEQGVPLYRSLFVRDLLNVAVTPATSDFGSVALNQTAPAATFTLANNGNGPVTVSGITVTGTDSAMFAVAPGSATTACTSLTPTLQPAASCTVAVTFTPASSGAKSATLRVASNADNQPVTEVSLTGTGATETVPPEQVGLPQIMKAYQSVLGKAQLTDAEKTACDVAPLGSNGRPNPNGVVDTADVVLLLRKLINVISW